MNTSVGPSMLLATPAAPPAIAVEHFAAKLALETDPSDVHADMSAQLGGFVVVDARSREAYREAHVPGAVSLPYREMDEATVAAIAGVDDVIVVYCAGPHCNASTNGALRLARLGYRVKEMVGGIDGWRRDGFGVATGDEP